MTVLIINFANNFLAVKYGHPIYEKNKNIKLINWIPQEY